MAKASARRSCKWRWQSCGLLDTWCFTQIIIKICITHISLQRGAKCTAQTVLHASVLAGMARKIS